MLEVASSEPCEGNGAEFWMWAHVRTDRHKAGLVKMILPGTRKTVMNALGLPNAFNPGAMLELAAMVPDQREYLQQVDTLATGSLVQYCNRKSHADGRETRRDSNSPEAMERSLWVPHGAAIIAVHGWSLDLDDQGVGKATRLDPAHVVIDPVVSVPLTWAEQRGFAHRLKMNVIRTSPTVQGADAVFATLHSVELGELIEHLYTPGQGVVSGGG